MRRLCERLRAFWREIEPSLSTFYDKGGIERRDENGAGPGLSISFDGFGITFYFLVGRTPRPRAGKR